MTKQTTCDQKFIDHMKNIDTMLRWHSWDAIDNYGFFLCTTENTFGWHPIELLEFELATTEDRYTPREAFDVYGNIPIHWQLSPEDGFIMVFNGSRVIKACYYYQDTIHELNPEETIKLGNLMECYTRLQGLI